MECIPYPLRYLSLALPQTLASEALRCIMYRGETPPPAAAATAAAHTHDTMWVSFTVSHAVWFCVCLCVCLYVEHMWLGLLCSVWPVNQLLV